jgi:Rrf2 family transcriptional regulator, iron-sulfur cluster assembly transcription factor
MLSITSQYALRALSHLARQNEKTVLGRDLAQSVEIPANYLSKVLLVLRNAGLVDTTRGAGGGYRLGRPANEIRLIDVVELFEEIPPRETIVLPRPRASLLQYPPLYGA